ncbi:hypothetical protein AVEN_104862-1 [Araneus ventricosus]|uniref:Uncharacterized protein n=1 Tax=Araneus ventricosus TaxID=182803 RepID=A0A4Y2INX5_ARAVE|nr:hypothetical protein AVEN_104862-1 [Araneus ventricosus]
MYGNKIFFHVNRSANLSNTSTTETSEYPPDSPNHAPRDFHLFGPLKKQLASRRFRIDAEVQEVDVKWLRDLDPNFFYKGFDRLVYR